MRRISFSILVFSLASSAWAGVQEGLAAYKDKDYATALVELRAAANSGFSNAQFFLGVMYENGQGVMQNDKEATAWYRKAAYQGYAVAQFFLGLRYANGQGVDRKSVV